MSNQVIKVGMADLNIAKDSAVLTTLGLGSCIGIALYDPASKIAGMAHIMLPDSTQIANDTNSAKFADTAMKVLIERMEEEGAKRHRIVAKIAGGAQMFKFKYMNDSMRIGMRNTKAVKEILKDYKIPLLAEDTGEDYGRTIELYSDTGKLVVRTIGHGIKEL